MTCFKLWRFFIYYRKTRNSRFEKITSIIETSHHNLIKFRIFYSWKLKVIEHRSLKNSIISFWNSGGMKEGDDPESGSDLEKAHLNSDHHLSERNEISPQTPLRLSASSLSREEPRYEDKSEIGFMDIFSSSGSDLDSPTRTQAELVKDRESEGLEDSKELPSLGREYVNRLFSSSETDSDSSFFTPVAKSGPGIRPSPPPKILQEPPLHPNPNPRKALQEQLPQGGGVRDPSDTRARILSPFASNPYSDGDLDIEELRSAQAMRRDGIQPKPSQLPDISPLPSPRIPPPQHSNHASPPHPTTYSIWNKASPNPFIPARQPQIHDSELLHADSTSSLPSSLASPPTFSYPNHPILMQNNNSTNTSLQDLPQNPYFISSPSPHQIHHHSLHPPNQILSESDTELSSP
ncbi:very low complexity large protein [Cryptosporidium canis]|uniref:Very low complexity large protein n=1 Tax=Cryptosporidium canis TaxID=195482 RepID=A0ABQ8P619_9CRYT|nr:very low complexity large protein [Cryptosporidium canis]KAJ1609361.1 very low complexity large protein [Cryptosporidium canis]